MTCYRIVSLGHLSVDCRLYCGPPYARRLSIARAFPALPSKSKSFRPQTEVECIECNETWQGSRLINYLFIGVYVIPCDCYCDVIFDVQTWHQKENSLNKW